MGSVTVAARKEGDMAQEREVKLVPRGTEI